MGGKGGIRKSIKIDLQEQVDSIGANKNCTRLVAAGSKGLLKIFAVEECGFRFVSDLRAVRSRRLNLMYSASHVAWSPMTDNTIATTSTNGAVVLWDVQRAQLDHTYKAHTRSATKVCFHQTDRNALISGAKDAAVIQYDLRISEPVKKFMSGSCDPIRDMQFGLHSNHVDVFVVADDGGSIRFWDLRRNDRPVHQFVAHHGPSSVAFNPNYDDQNLIATAGRDKFIRIWKWSDWSENANNSAMYAVEATASVSKIYWRPQNKYQVASCSVVNDINIHIWDIRRPYLPYASFDEHRDICSDMVWPADDANVFLSAGKDGLLVMHFVENAQHPINHVSDVALDVSPSGVIAIAISSQLKYKNEALAELEKVRKGESFLPRRRKYDPFQSTIPSYLICCEPSENSQQISSEQFVTLAKRYKLCGDDVPSLCFYNSRVAEEVSKYQVAHAWRTVGMLYAFTTFFCDSTNKDLQCCHDTDGKDANGAGRSRFPSSLSSGGVVRNVDGHDITGTIFANIIPAMCSTSSDFFFGDGELNVAGLSAETLEFSSSQVFEAPSSLKMEAFSPRPYEDIENIGQGCSMSSERSTIDEIDVEMGEALQEQTQIGNLTIKADLACTPPWDPLALIRSMFEFYSDLGDVQTCVSVLLVLGERTKELIDSAKQKLWLFDYLEMLECYELWNAAAEIIKLSWIAVVNDLSNQGTSVKLLCANCKTVSVSATPYCNKCLRLFAFKCSLCSLPVSGVWSWCRGCAHGGHPEHLAQWFAENSRCPTGCGHLCSK